VEEVMLLREEMRRVLRYLKWQAAWWDGRGDVRTGVDTALRSGLRGYAAKQVSLHRRLSEYFFKEWDSPADAVSRRLAVLDSAAASEEGVGLEQLFSMS
jgi:hypothetical protein